MSLLSYFQYVLDVDPFKEFDEPEEPSTVTPLDDGSFIIHPGTQPPVPWHTSYFSLIDTIGEVRSCYSLFWRVDKQAGLESLAGIIQRLKEEHHAELEEAALEHELADTPTWPVEQLLEDARSLHAGWLEIIEGQDSAQS